jgi:hypothetical protein
LRLTKKAKHARFFVEEKNLLSLSNLQQSLREHFENPLSKLPANAYSISVVLDGDDEVEETSEEQEGSQGGQSIPWSARAEKIIRSDQELKAAYETVQRSRYVL